MSPSPQQANNDKMKCEDEENDFVIAEIPVYLSKTLLDKLYVLQYPVRPRSHSYDDATILKAKIRPQSGHVEIETGLRTRIQTYDKSKGEQIAFNVDGAYREMRDSDDNFYKSNVMDKLVLTSSKALSDSSRYAIGVSRDNSLHLSPVTTVLALRPSFSYLDQADKRGQQDRKDATGEDDSDEEDKARKVTVRFEKPETEKSRKAKEKSYGFLIKKIRDEPWIEVDYCKHGAERSEFEKRKLACLYDDEHTDQFSLEASKYMKQLVPPIEEAQVIAPGLPAHLMSRSVLALLPLHDRVKAVMVNAGVICFGELLSVLKTGENSESCQSVLKVLQQVAVLVQGNWVVKSDIVYPKNTKSESGVANDLIQRGRDYVLCLFTKMTTITRSQVADVVGLPSSDLNEILRGVSQYRSDRCVWEFLLPADTGFLDKYPDVVQRQQMIWQSRSEQLAHNYKDNTIGESGKCSSSASSSPKKSRCVQIKSEPEEDKNTTKPQSGPAMERRSKK